MHFQMVFEIFQTIRLLNNAILERIYILYLLKRGQRWLCWLCGRGAYDGALRLHSRQLADFPVCQVTGQKTMAWDRVCLADTPWCAACKLSISAARNADGTILPICVDRESLHQVCTGSICT